MSEEGRGMELVPENIEVTRGPAGCPTYTLRIISKIKFKLWDWRRWDSNMLYPWTLKMPCLF